MPTLQLREGKEMLVKDRGLSFAVACIFVGFFSFHASNTIAAQEWRLSEFALESELVPSPIAIGALLPPSYATSVEPLPLLLLSRWRWEQ